MDEVELRNELKRVARDRENWGPERRREAAELLALAHESRAFTNKELRQILGASRLEIWKLICLAGWISGDD